MPRKPRIYVAGMPCHVIQRGNNRQACLFALDDYRQYLAFLKDACRRYRVAVHAYVLMTNHAHLLMTPETAEGISRVMQSLGRRYVQRVNHLYGRCGTLWEGRHKSSLVDAEAYLLACPGFVFLDEPVQRGNPVASPSSGIPDAKCGIDENETHLSPTPFLLLNAPSSPCCAFFVRGRDMCRTMYGILTPEKSP